MSSVHCTNSGRFLLQRIWIYLNRLIHTYIHTVHSVRLYLYIHETSSINYREDGHAKILSGISPSVVRWTWPFRLRPFESSSSSQRRSSRWPWWRWWGRPPLWGENPSSRLTEMPRWCWRLPLGAVVRSLEGWMGTWAAWHRRLYENAWSEFCSNDSKAPVSNFIINNNKKINNKKFHDNNNNVTHFNDV